MFIMRKHTVKWRNIFKKSDISREKKFGTCRVIILMGMKSNGET